MSLYSRRDLPVFVDRPLPHQDSLPTSGSGNPWLTASVYTVTPNSPAAVIVGGGGGGGAGLNPQVSQNGTVTPLNPPGGGYLNIALGPSARAVPHKVELSETKSMPDPAMQAAVDWLMASDATPGNPQEGE